MGANLDMPLKIESNVVNFSSGGNDTIKKDFVEPGLKMSNPMLRRAKLRCRVNVTTSATGQPTVARGGMFTHALSKIIMQDRSGERLNISGGEARVMAQHELGWSYLDQPDMADNLAAQNVEFYLPLLFTLGDKASSYDDTAIALADFYAGGEIVLNFVGRTIGPGNATGPTITVNSGQFSVVAEIYDAGQDDIPSRLATTSTALTSNDTAYPINGKLRAALLYIGLVNEEAGLTWGTAGATTESRSLNMQNYPQPALVEDYIEEGYNDPTIDAVINGFVLPFFSPPRGGKIVRMPVFNDLHVKFSQALPAGSTLLRQIYTQRSDESIALALRSPQKLQALAGGAGVVPGNSGAVARGSVPASQAKYLPFRVAATSREAGPPVSPVGNVTR